jgi:hypothetical protein
MCDYTPLVETREIYKPKLIEILRQNKFKQTILAETTAKKYLIDLSDETIKTDIKYLIKNTERYSLTYASVNFELQLDDKSQLLSCKKISHIWKSLPSEITESKGPFFRKFWVDFCQKQLLRLVKEFSEEIGMNVVEKQNQTDEGVCIDFKTMKIHVWW